MTYLLHQVKKKEKRKKKQARRLHTPPLDAA
jgi:hypothetical protein